MWTTAYCGAMQTIDVTRYILPQFVKDVQLEFIIQEIKRVYL